MRSLGFLYIGGCMLCRAGAVKDNMPNGTSRDCKRMIRQDRNFTKQNLAIVRTMIWQMISKLSYLIPMNGQRYLNNPVQNILYLLPNIMMALPYGRVKKQTGTGALNGMQQMLARKEICWVTCLRQYERRLCMPVCTIHCMNG